MAFYLLTCGRGEQAPSLLLGIGPIAAVELDEPSDQAALESAHICKPEPKEYKFKKRREENVQSEIRANSAAGI